MRGRKASQTDEASRQQQQRENLPGPCAMNLFVWAIAALIFNAPHILWMTSSGS